MYGSVVGSVCVWECGGECVCVWECGGKSVWRECVGRVCVYMCVILPTRMNKVTPRDQTSAAEGS